MNRPHSLVGNDLTLGNRIKEPVDRLDCGHNALGTDAVQSHGLLEQVRGVAQSIGAIVVEPANQRTENVHLAVDHQRVVTQQLADAVRR